MQPHSSTFAEGSSLDGCLAAHFNSLLGVPACRKLRLIGKSSDAINLYTSRPRWLGASPLGGSLTELNHPLPASGPQPRTMCICATR